MLKHDAMLFFAALLFLFILWVAVGGPSRPISWSGPFLNAPAPLGNGSAYFLSGAGFGIGSTTTTLGLDGFSIGTGGSFSLNTGNTVTLNENGGSDGSNDAAYFTNPSPYRGEVYFDTNVDGPEEQLAAEEELDIDVSSNAPGPIDISGWRLVSTDSTGVIPQGTLVPTGGAVNPVSDIMLQPGDEAIVVSGISPIGVSFRENECTGYLDQYQSFHPPLDHECPSVISLYDEQYESNDESPAIQDCQDFISSLYRCDTVTNFPTDENGNQEVADSCQAFVNQHDTYNGCVADFASDPDFAGDVWRVYLGSRAGLWGDDHDTIRLIDTQGRTVDVFSY